ncbi:hypothetical protein BN2476_460135 [Paraburkholderia piptadeniae]|uniref:Uncharacterized protein n=1 Tax=Paraburkholderia piptadeniae TaxID=1701573 RepID=A0A1N7SE89_9BURK|nr:hypothetical protein BN2476_460135 [Paraburkholderia piptadeniae]
MCTPVYAHKRFMLRSANRLSHRSTRPRSLRDLDRLYAHKPGCTWLHYLRDEAIRLLGANRTKGYESRAPQTAALNF